VGYTKENIMFLPRFQRHYLLGILLLGLVLLTGWIALRFFQPAKTENVKVAGSTKQNPEQATPEVVVPPSLPASNPVTPKTDHLAKAKLKEAYGKLPLSFEANQGQANKEVKFISQGSGYKLFLTATKAVMTLNSSRESKAKDQKSFIKDNKLDRGLQTPSLDQTVLQMQLVGANPAPGITGIDLLPGKSNYFIGNDPKEWRTNIAQYAKVRYQNVYPGVDMVYYGNQRQLEYDFIVAPGSDPEKIRLRFKDVEKVKIDNKGDLVVEVLDGEIRNQRPIFYQKEDGNKKIIAGNYVLKGKHEVGFQVDDYDSSKPLIIDPVLLYSTYLGGSDVDGPLGIAIDSEGSAYVAGSTTSTNFPTANPLQPNKRNGADIFVTKINPAGNMLVYSTYLGGTSNQFGNFDDVATDIALDSEGNVYIGGNTYCTDFPTVNAFRSTGTCFCSPECVCTFSDSFVTKLNSTGSALLYSTYLSGSYTESLNAITVDSDGNAYVTGYTASVDYPKRNPLQGLFNGTGDVFNATGDAFIAKFNTNAVGDSSLVYSTYLGSSGDEGGSDIAVDMDGNAYVIGSTNSDNYPTTANAFQPTAPLPTLPLNDPNLADVDVFLAKLSAEGNSLMYSTYIGSNGYEYSNAITVDSSGNAYITGYTDSTTFPIANPLQATFGGATDVFIIKLNTNTEGIGSLVYSTYLGGSDNDSSSDIAIDGCGNIYVGGITDSSNFPTMNPFQATLSGVSDSFLAKLNATGSRLLYSTYLGGSSSDGIVGLAVDSVGNIYLAGYTISTNFPLSSPLQTSCNGCGNSFGDAFIAKMAVSSPGVLQFGSSESEIVEFDGNATISITRLDGEAGTVLINYATSSVTATVGQDYIATSGTLTFVDGELIKNIFIPIKDDDLIEGEGPEIINITLSSPTGGAVLGIHSVLTLMIFDDDFAIGHLSTKPELDFTYTCILPSSLIYNSPIPPALKRAIVPVTSFLFQRPNNYEKRLIRKHSSAVATKPFDYWI
jgi:hypothetical protein